MDIAPAAVSPFQKHKIFPLFSKIQNKPIGERFPDKRARRQGNYYIFAIAPVPAPAFAVMAVLRLKRMRIAQVGKGTQISAYGKHHVAAAASVAACWPAPGHKFLPAKRGAAVAACPRGNFNYGLIGKFFHNSKLPKKRH
jgi:hypothetical protein